MIPVRIGDRVVGRVTNVSGGDDGWMDVEMVIDDPGLGLTHKEKET